MNKLWLFLFTFCAVLDSAWAQRMVPAPTQCYREQTSDFLYLTVRSCLQTTDPKANAASEDGLVVTKAMQTITNNSNQRVHLLIFEEEFVSSLLNVRSNGGWISRELSAPMLHDPTYQPKKRVTVGIDAGRSVTFLYEFSDFLIKQPVEGVLYTISMGCRFNYRFENETNLQWRDRFPKETEKAKPCLSHRFRDLRLK